VWADHFSAEPLQQWGYVADSALVTGLNLATLASRDLRCVARRPETFSAPAVAKAAAWATDGWIPGGASGYGSMRPLPSVGTDRCHR
jgi:hypothetical protein